MSIGEKIVEARRAKNLTQEQLAELLGVTRQSISRWEQNQAYPEVEKILRLSDILGVSCDYLLKGNVTKNRGKFPRFITLPSQAVFQIPRSAFRRGRSACRKTA